MNINHILKSTIAILLCILMIATTFLTSCDSDLLENTDIKKDTESELELPNDESDTDDSAEDNTEGNTEDVKESENNVEDNNTDDKEATDIESIIFKTLIFKDENTLECSVPNSVTSFNFKNEITINSKFNYVVALDEFGMQTVVTKTVALTEGDNKFYIILSEGESYSTFSVTIRRRPMYLVKFNTNGGTTVSDQSVEEGSLVNAPTTSKDGYSFVAWDTDLTLPITSDITISAIWSGCPYTITYDANGGSVSAPTVNVTLGESYALETPTREGYSFDCWLYGSTYVANTGVWNIPENATIKATWIPHGNIPYKVEHYIEMLDGSYKLVDTDNLKGSSDSIIIPDTKTYTGFTAPVKQQATILVNGSQVIKYRYTRNTYNINFVTNGGEEMLPQSFKYEEQLISINEATREGYKIMG